MLTGIIGFIAYPEFAKKEVGLFAEQPGINSQTLNHKPQIKFLEPSAKSVHSWMDVVHYSIEVSDPEDGESKYQEIQSNEVLVRMKYLENQTKSTAYLNQRKFADTAGINNMLMSNCFNCHAVKTKMAGPSFLDIVVRYENTIKNQDLLISQIRHGSKGIWGLEVMPTHPELSDSVVRRMVKWIFNFANAPGLNFFVGTQGILPLNNPSKTIRKGIFIIDAFYTDHGTTDQPDDRLTGTARVIIQMK